METKVLGDAQGFREEGRWGGCPGLFRDGIEKKVDERGVISTFLCRVFKSVWSRNLVNDKIVQCFKCVNIQYVQCSKQTFYIYIIFYLSVHPDVIICVLP